VGRDRRVVTLLIWVSEPRGKEFMPSR
jgi:hypothetical protein